MKKKLYTLVTILIVKGKDWLGAIRLYLLKVQGASLGRNVRVYGSVHVTNPHKLKVGDNTSLNHGVFLGCRGGVEIGCNCHISPMAQIHSGKLKVNEMNREHEGDRVILEDGVWLASGVVVSAGVTIGENSVVAANSVVIKDVPENVFVSGNPAKVIRNL